jgi:hypothetical protein
MSFQLLAPDLHATAHAAQKYFAAEHGAKGFHHETIVGKNLSLRPTLSAHLSDGCILCVEVSEKAYSNSLDTFVVECSTCSLPVKLYVVLPSSKGDAEFGPNLRKAKARGVGVIEIGDTGASACAEAVSLSLFGVRRIVMSEFPKGRRESVRQAEQTFLNGNPVKGCQSLYEELEAVTRAFAKYSKAQGWWRAPYQGEVHPSANIETGSWATVLRELGTFLDLSSCQRKCPLMKDALIASVRAVTDPRNLTSHKPNKLRAIIERDRKLRTWFETSSDLLKVWYEATKPLKL